MPKSRGRRNRHRRQQRGRAATPRRRVDGWSGAEVAAYGSHLRVLQEVDARERAGDPAGALDLMERFPRGPDGGRFWAWWRVERLVQITAMPDLLPGWAMSRWVVAQALIHLDGRTRVTNRQALGAACRVGGHPELARRRDRDSRALLVALMDHDWIYRQAFLYEYGGLAHFLSRGGLAAAVRREADSVDDWARASMGAFRLVGTSPRTITWTDLTSGEDVQVINLGSAVSLAPGDHVLGRAVPSRAGQLFESPPLPVDEAVAAAVAKDPATWLGVLTDAGTVPTLALPGDLAPLLTDVPTHVWRGLAEDHSCLLVDRFGDRDPVGVVLTTEDLDQMAADLVLAAIDGRVGEGGDVDPWPCIAAAATAADVWPRVLLGLDRQQAAAVAGLGERLAGPATELCWRTARTLRSTA